MVVTDFYKACIYKALLLPNTGEIDREMMPDHRFIVTATDGGGLDTSTIYAITVTDENDNSPVFTTGSSYTISLFEDEDLNEVY